jgi:ribosomal protein L27
MRHCGGIAQARLGQKSMDAELMEATLIIYRIRG